MVHALWKTVWRLPKKLQMELLCDPAIPHLGMYPPKLKAGTRRDTCTAMFRAALFVLAKSGSHPRGGIYITMGYYSALKNKEILSCSAVWLKLEDIVFSEISQSQKDKYCVIPLVRRTRAVRLIGTESRCG